jgi:AbrB family looped-hinge helix DNA binding protein
MESRLTTKGRITLPKELRVHLNLKPGDKLHFFIDSHGKAGFVPKPSASRNRKTRQE